MHTPTHARVSCSLAEATQQKGMQGEPHTPQPLARQPVDLLGHAQEPNPATTKPSGTASLPGHPHIRTLATSPPPK